MQSNENIIVSINQRSIELYINDWFLQYLECLSLLISINSNALEIHVAMNL